MSDYKNWKPLLDYACALILLLLICPFLLLISLCIKLEDPTGPVIFRQKRVGKDNQIFILYKLRSMRVETERKGRELADEERMLKVGKFIRKTSLDELPQLWNILKGEMSFIGPRPLLPEYLPYYNEMERKRHEVKPGISGWAQVNGRNRVTWEEKFMLDLEYIARLNLNLDLLIIWLTIKKVFVASDIIEAGHETTQDFTEYRSSQLNFAETYDQNIHIEKRDS